MENSDNSEWDINPTKVVCELIPEFGELPIGIAKPIMDKFMTECPIGLTTEPLDLIDALRSYLTARYGMKLARESTLVVEWNSDWYKSEKWSHDKAWFDGGSK